MKNRTSVKTPQEHDKTKTDNNSKVLDRNSHKIPYQLTGLYNPSNYHFPRIRYSPASNQYELLDDDEETTMTEESTHYIKKYFLRTDTAI